MDADLDVRDKTGEVLLQAPLSSFRTRQTAPKDLARRAQGASVHGLLALALALEAANDEPSTAPWRAVLPSPQDLSSMPIHWDPALQSRLPRPARDLLARQQKKLSSDWDAVSSLGVGREEYTHHWLLVNTRSFYHSPSAHRAQNPQDKLALIPAADLLNHSSTGCRETFSSRGLSIAADRAYPADTEIHICYGRHGNDFLLTEYGFLLFPNDWDEVSLDDLLLPLLSEGQKEKLRDLGFLGRWVLDARTPGCFRTQVALRVLRGGDAGLFLRGEEGEEAQRAVDQCFDEILAGYLDEVEAVVGEVQGMGPEGEVLAGRWRQIGELVRGTRAQLAR